MTGPLGVYNRSAKFSDLRQALRKEAEDAKDLAQRIAATTGATQIALNYLLRPKPGYLIDQQTIDDTFWRRHEVAKDLKRYADEVDRLVKHDEWPEGGKWNLAKEHLGPPKRRLVKECIKVFWKYGDRNEIEKPLSRRADGSLFGAYVGAIYELGAGEFPWGDRVGLHKIVNETVRQWRENEARPSP